MKNEPNPAALEAMARAGYERDLQNLPHMFDAATWEQLGPTTREKWMDAAAKILQPYLDALPSDTSLQEIIERAARPNALHGMPQDYADGYTHALDKIAELVEDHAQAAAPATPAPPGAGAILKILEDHTAKRPWSEASRMKCKCGEVVTAETEGQLHHLHRQHVAAMIEKGSTP